jgi:hypothetical protein
MLDREALIRVANDRSLESNLEFTAATSFQRLPFGAIHPTGWILAQMQRDLDSGFAGCLDQLCPCLFAAVNTSCANTPSPASRTSPSNPKNPQIFASIRELRLELRAP